MKKQYTKEERAEYFKTLRERWTENKAQSEQDTDVRVKYEAIKKESPTFQISYTSFYFTMQSMKAQGLDGLPYIDAKTFNGWKSSGFKVRKGEHSKIDGITWIVSDKNKKDNGIKESIGSSESVTIYPKMYALFHKSQVESIT